MAVPHRTPKFGWIARIRTTQCQLIFMIFWFRFIIILSYYRFFSLCVLKIYFQFLNFNHVVFCCQDQLKLNSIFPKSFDFWDLILNVIPHIYTLKNIAMSFRYPLCPWSVKKRLLWETISLQSGKKRLYDYEKDLLSSRSSILPNQ